MCYKCFKWLFLSYKKSWQSTQTQILAMFSWGLLESWKVNPPTIEVGSTLEIYVPQEGVGAEEIKGRGIRALDSGPVGEMVRNLMVQMWGKIDKMIDVWMRVGRQRIEDVLKNVSQ